MGGGSLRCHHRPRRSPRLTEYHDPVRILLAVVAAVVVVVLAATYLAYRRFLGRSLPQTKGSVTVDAITAPVTVSRDRDGLVHVAAETMTDAAFAMGFVHAQERLWQLELTRRVAAGRISEFAAGEGVAADRFMRRVGLHRIAKAEAAGLEGEPKAMLEAYAAGINAIIGSSRPLPIEFRLLKFKPEQWTVADSLSCAKLLALGLSTNWDNEIQRLDLLRQVGPIRAASLDLIYPDANPTILDETAHLAGRRAVDSSLDLFHEAARWIPSTGGGSNSWAVSGSRTESGRPLLCNDPHLPPQVPSIWFQAHVTVAGDFDTTGVTFASQPFPIIGHNEHVAWGFTNSFADCQDLVIEDFEDAAMRRYRTEAGAVDSTIVREVIRVKGASDIVEEVVVTRHGPIVERLEDQGKGVWRGLALQWTALQPGDSTGAILRAQRATSGDTLRKAFVGFDAPAQNVVWADTGGHIGYFLSGRIPVRRRAPSGLPVAGWNGDALWERMLTADESPAVVDPAQGFIVTANNRIVGADFPHYIGSDYMNGYRALRITELLKDTVPLTPQRMNDIQMDTVSPPAREVVKLMRDLRCSSAAAEKLRAKLMAWDGTMDPRRSEPTVYALFIERLAEEALAPLCGDAWRTVATRDRTHDVFGFPGNIVGRLTPVLLQRWRDDDVAFLEKRSTWPEIAARALEAVAGDKRSKRRWGRVHRLPLVHQLGAANRVAAFIFNPRGMRIGGDSDTVMATSKIPSEHGFEARLFTPSWRQIVDVGNWDASTGVHYPGQSGQPGSRHYSDLSARWRRNRQLTLAFSKDAVTASVRESLKLVPRGGEATP